MNMSTPPSQYRIIRGTAAQVELEVQQLLDKNENWTLNGPLTTIRFDSTTTIFAQGLVRYNK